MVKLLRNMGAFVGSIVLLIMRLYWGYQFFKIGWAKLGDLTDATQMMQIIAYVETISGLCLLFGLLSRLAAIPLIITMFITYFTAHFEAIKMIFSNPNLFMDEEPFMFLLTSLLVFSFGAGYFSLDHYFTRKKSKKKVTVEEEEE